MKQFAEKIIVEANRIWDSLAESNAPFQVSGNCPIGPEAAERLLAFTDLVLEWNDKVDLVSRCTKDEVVERHILDSLGLWFCMRQFLGDKANIFDIGSGGGFPGVVVALMSPEWSVTLVEPRNKRCIFLQEARRRLGIVKLKVFEGSLVELVKQRAGKEASPVLTFRGLTPDSSFLLQASRLVAPGNHIVLFYLTGDIILFENGSGSTNHVDFRASSTGSGRRIYRWSDDT